MHSQEQLVKRDGIVEEALPGLLFRVTLRDSAGASRAILAHLAGRLKLHRIRVIPGDRVVVEMAHEHDERGRIVRRL